MTDNRPPGWPEAVRPPGAPEWEATAVAWLLDLCPGEFRLYEVLRRHPVVLARFAAHQVAAEREAAARGLATVRDELRDVVGPEAVEAAVLAYQRESARVAVLVRQVEVVERALRGERYMPRL